MKASAKAFEFIMQEEGCILHTYKDQAGINTIGVGSTMYKDGTRPKMGDRITEDQAMELLAWEVENKTAAIRGMLQNYALNQNQIDSLISFAFNVGVGALANSTLLRLIKKNPCDPAIRDAFGMWNKVTINGRKAANAGLTARRKREADLYFSKIL